MTKDHTAIITTPQLANTASRISFKKTYMGLVAGQGVCVRLWYVALHLSSLHDL